MNTNGFINVNHIFECYREHFARMASLLDEADETSVEVDITLDNWEPGQKQSWDYWGGTEYIPAGYCTVSSVSYNGIDITRWLNREGERYILMNQGEFVNDYF